MTKQKQHINPMTHKQRRATTEEPIWNKLQRNYCGWLVGFKPVLLVRKLTINSALSYKYMFDQHSGPLPRL